MVKKESELIIGKNLAELKRLFDDNKVKLILFGEYHGFSIQISIINEIIKITNPNFFLYEMLEEERIISDKDARKFLNKQNNKDFSFISKYRHLKPVIRLARKFDLPIIGYDIKNMGVNNKEWKFSREEGKKLTNKRELQQAKIINKYISKGIVFVLLGNYHLRKSNLTLSKLKSRKAVIIRPSFEWKEEFNKSHRIHNSSLSYNLKLLNKSS